MSYFDLLFFYYFYYNTKSVSFQIHVADILPKKNENNKIVHIEFQMQNTCFKIGLGYLRMQTWADAVQNEAESQSSPLREPPYCPYIFSSIVILQRCQ